MKTKYLVLVVWFKKPNYGTKITEIEKKLIGHDHDITTPEFNNLAARVSDARIRQADLVTKADFDTKLRCFNQNNNPTKTKYLLVENEFKKLKTLDLRYFKGKSYFEEDGTQKCLVFQPMYRYLKMIPNKKYISEWKCKGLTDESIKPSTSSDNSLSPLIVYLGKKIRQKSDGSCLKQHKLTYTPQTIVNI